LIDDLTTHTIGGIRFSTFMITR